MLTKKKLLKKLVSVLANFIYITNAIKKHIILNFILFIYYLVYF